MVVLIESLEETVAKLASDGKGKVTHLSPEYIDTRISTMNLSDVEGAIRARMSMRKKNKLTQYSARVNIPSNLPILLVLMGDNHYGSGDTDHELMLKDFETIKSTPGVYVAFMANLIDNGIPGQFPDGMLQNVIPPEEQVIAMRKYIQDFDSLNKVVGAIVSPCHEGWTWKKAGQDINRLLFDYEGRKFPVLENGGKLILDVNGAEYYTALYHQLGPFNSNLNKNNGTQRMKQLQHRNADIVAAAHHHTSEAMQTFSDKGDDMKPICYLRTGCYKLDDQWSKGKGYVGGEPGGQSVILFPQVKKMQPVLELDTAIRLHKGVYLQRLLENEGLADKIASFYK